MDEAKRIAKLRNDKPGAVNLKFENGHSDFHVHYLSALAEIAQSIYRMNAERHKEIADRYFEAGQKEKARIYYKKALELDPKLAEAKKRLEELEKEKKK